MKGLIIVMLRFNLKNLTLGKKITYLIMILVGLFFIFESFLPVSSGLLVGRSSYSLDYSLNQITAPSYLSFDDDYYDVFTNKNVYIKYKSDATEKCSNQINYWSDNESVATVYSTSFGEIIVTGISQGKTKIYISSIYDNRVSASVLINVYESTPFNFDGIKTPTPCITLDDSLIYQNRIVVNYGQRAKLNYVVKNSSLTVVSRDIMLRTDTAFDGIVDKNGNILFCNNFIGKDIEIEVYSKYLSESYGLSSVKYSIHINYPPNYGDIFIRSYLANFLNYVLCFIFIGILFGLLFNLIFESSKKVIAFGAASSFAFSLFALFIQYFALSRAFIYYYWFVSPLLAAITCLLSSAPVRSLIIKFIRSIFYEK